MDQKKEMLGSEKISIDVEKIMQEIRSKIQAEELAASMPDFSQVPINGESQENMTSAVGGENWEEFMGALSYMNANHQIPYYWNLGPAGIKTFAKRIIRKLAKCIIAPILAKQGQFNACTVRCMNTVRYFIEGQRRIIEEQRRINDQIKAENSNVRLAFETQESRIHDLCNELAQTTQQLQELQGKTGMYVTNLLEVQDQMEILAREGAFISSARDANSVKMSAAQSGEDMILEYIIGSLHRDPAKETYLDLGANHAKYLSNTYFFYKRGARGVLVEANPSLIAELKFYRSGDVILNRCISDVSGQEMDFFILTNDGLSTPDKKGAEAAMGENTAVQLDKVVTVKSITVEEIFETYFDAAPTILNLDIEGKEMEILNSIDFTKYRPLIMIIETIPYRRHLVVGEKNDDVIEFMKSKNYTEYAFTGINSIFLDQEQVDKILENWD